MQAPPHPYPIPSFGFAREVPEPQFFNTVNVDDSPEIPPADVPDSFAVEISAAYSNIPSGKSRPSMQHVAAFIFGVGQGTPRFRSFAGNIGGAIVQDTAFSQSRHSHREGGFGSTLSGRDCASAPCFGHPQAQPSQGRLAQTIGMQWHRKEPPTFLEIASKDADTLVSIASNYFAFMLGTPQ